jgi:hypothetical protein
MGQGFIQALHVTSLVLAVIPCDGANEDRGQRKPSITHVNGVVEFSFRVHNALVGEMHSVNSPVEGAPGMVWREAETSFV